MIASFNIDSLMNHCIDLGMKSRSQVIFYFTSLLSLRNCFLVRDRKGVGSNEREDEEELGEVERLETLIRKSYVRKIYREKRSYYCACILECILKFSC